MVLLDEPFSSLDAGLREETGRAVARALRASEATAVLVTHDQGEALSLADQVAVMADGRFLQVGDARPRSTSTRPPPRWRPSWGTRRWCRRPRRNGIARSALGDVPVRGARDGRVLLAVRPEQVAVTAKDEAGSLAAEVLEVSFFGHDATVRARVAGPDELVEVTARVPATGVPQPGAEIGVRVVGEVLAFPASAGSTS